MALPSGSTSWLVDLTAVLSDVRFWHETIIGSQGRAVAEDVIWG
jgi:hypothetical protein